MRCSRRSPLEPAPLIPFLLWAITLVWHHWFSPIRNLNKTWVKPTTSYVRILYFVVSDKDIQAGPLDGGFLCALSARGVPALSEVQHDKEGGSKEYIHPIVAEAELKWPQLQLETHCWGGITMGVACHFNIFAVCLENQRVSPAAFFRRMLHHPLAVPGWLHQTPWPGHPTPARVVVRRRVPFGAVSVLSAWSRAARLSPASAAQGGGSNPPPLPAALMGAFSFSLQSFPAGQLRASWGGWASPRRWREVGETIPSPCCCCWSCAGAGAVDVAPQS